MNEFVVRLNGSVKRVKLIDTKIIEVDGVKLNYSFSELDDSRIILRIENKIFETYYSRINGDKLSFLINNESLNITIRTILQDTAYQILSESKDKTQQINTIKSPMPGLVVKINKKVGDKIEKGDTVMILEAMKMENEIKANLGGIISEIFVQEGSPIEKNISLFSIK